MLILASQSPRRRELLKKIVPDFLVKPANVDEHIDVSPEELPIAASYVKAMTIKKEYPDYDVLGSDTVVIIDNKVLGKPVDEEDAFKMLKELSGREHYVISGFTLILGERVIKGSMKTIVHFNELSDELIWKYIKTGSPMDKAGAYGIQDKEFNLVRDIEGSMDNVIGLPTEEIAKYLR